MSEVPLYLVQAPACPSGYTSGETNSLINVNSLKTVNYVFDFRGKRVAARGTGVLGQIRHSGLSEMMSSVRLQWESKESKAPQGSPVG